MLCALVIFTFLFNITMFNIFYLLPVVMLQLLMKIRNAALAKQNEFKVILFYFSFVSMNKNVLQVLILALVNYNNPAAHIA